MLFASFEFEAAGPSEGLEYLPVRYLLSLRLQLVLGSSWARTRSLRRLVRHFRLRWTHCRPETVELIGCGGEAE